MAYAYDTANRLTSHSANSITSTYAYDGLGNRYQQTVDGQTTTYVLDLAAGLTQVLDDGDSQYLYGIGRIAEDDGTDWLYHHGDAVAPYGCLQDRYVC